MYDQRTEAKEFIGDDRRDAVAKACAFFGVEEGELAVHASESHEIYGLGGRTAIVAHPSGAPAPGDGPPRGRDDDDARGPRGREGGRDRGGRGGGRARDDRGGRGRGRDNDDGGRGRSRDRDDRGGSTPDAEAAAPERSAVRADVSLESIENSKGTAKGQIGDVGAFLVGAVERMGLGPFEISEATEGEFIVYELHGTAAEELGAGDGRAVDALQLLANQVAMRLDENTLRIVVDAEGNAERREAFLNRLADRAARRASDSGRSVALDPMNGRDRRMIHVALRDEEGVATMSIGSGRYRQVVVVPEDSPEYEEALKASQEVAAREN